MLNEVKPVHNVTHTLVLEIGCYTGYSALAWASALQKVEDAEVNLSILLDD